VRVLDEYAGSDGAKLDRILAQLQNSHSQVRILCADNFGIAPIPGGGTSGNYTFVNIAATDEFVSLAVQFQTFRVTAIRFDVYDTNNTVSVSSMFSTFHDQTTGSFTNLTQAQIVDRPDAQVVPSGVGKVSFTWFARGALEEEFQSTTSTSPKYSDFGGLSYFIGSGASTQKYQVVMKAVVDFRGRI